MEESKSESKETIPVKPVNAVIDSENMALTVMVAFLNIAHQRGVFNFEESAKILECIKMFER
jgi:hypothetical protein